MHRLGNYQVFERGSGTSFSVPRWLQILMVSAWRTWGQSLLPGTLWFLRNLKLYNLTSHDSFPNEQRTFTDALLQLEELVLILRVHYFESLPIPTIDLECHRSSLLHLGYELWPRITYHPLWIHASLQSCSGSACSRLPTNSQPAASEPDCTIRSLMTLFESLPRRVWQFSRLLPRLRSH
jgi:hypothetical protein